MPTSYLEYRLVDGFIDNWLVAGPQAIAVDAPERFESQARKLQIAEYYGVLPGGGADMAEPPVARGRLRVGGGDEFEWQYRRCPIDHRIDLATFYHNWTYLRAWAYAQIVSPVAGPVTMTLATNGPADVWLDGRHVHRQAHFYHQQPRSVTFEAAMQAGVNELLVRFEAVAARECPYGMALRLADAPAQAGAPILVRVPTPAQDAGRFQLLERVFEHAYVEQNVLYKGNKVPMRWSDETEGGVPYYYHIQDGRGRTYLEGKTETQPSRQINVGHPARLWEGAYWVTLRPSPREYFDFGMRIQRQLPFQVLDTPYSEAPYGTYTQRRQEALEYAAKRENDLYAEIAKMKLGRWDDLDLGVIQHAIDGINRRGDCSDFDLVGLLGVIYCYLDDPAFPQTLGDALKACVLGFKYWYDEPGVDAMCYTTENHSILFHTCEILAGQLYPDEIFTNVDRRGAWRRARGEKLAREWLRARGATGFCEWDSNCYFEQDLLALSHLIDWAENTEIRELAAVLMDKMFFTMAINSYKGVFGSTHGRTYAPSIKGGQLEPTSGIGRLMWGMGVWNRHIRGVVSLACSGYELPFIIADIAERLPQEFGNRERIVAPEADWRASGSLGFEVNKVTYKTPDYMLCSAQDYYPGEKGYQQHIWQATMGPDAVVFVNHPSCASENGAHRPNFWCGNAILPRVAQWRDVLVAIHRLSENDAEPDTPGGQAPFGLDFTHAYFPARAFDRYTLRDGWAFAQKGGGYLALTASQGVELIKQGPGACTELRSYGRQNVWLCQMGRAEIDGGFAQFRDKVLSMNVKFEGLSVDCTTLRGDTLQFGWTGPLLLNGEAQPQSGFKHYENPYCTVDLPAPEMEIRFDEYLLKLDFE